MSTNPRASLLEFPCDFPIKAFGHHGEEFEGVVLDIVLRHVSDPRAAELTSRASKGGKYAAVTVMVRAESQLQLDAIYRDLSGCSAVLMAL